MDTLTLPALAAIETEDEHGHGFIGTPRLLLRRRGFDALAPTARKQTSL
jgi:hypothetical protein